MPRSARLSCERGTAVAASGSGSATSDQQQRQHHSSAACLSGANVSCLPRLRRVSENSCGADARASWYAASFSSAPDTTPSVPPSSPIAWQLGWDKECF